MHAGMPYGRNQGQGQSREVDRQSPTGLILLVQTTHLTKLEYYISLVHVHQPRMAPVSQTLTSDQLSVAKLLVTLCFHFVCLSVCLSVGRITQKVVDQFVV